MEEAGEARLTEHQRKWLARRLRPETNLRELLENLCM